ncbi:MAG: ATP-binding cassette domain-containing protein [Actinomycetota bacterium]|nr:ATP-binding cassette domain-containing protein [Actinomycetota bacterium]
MSEAETTTAPWDGGGTLEHPPAIVVRGLEKSFGDVHAVRGVDFEVEMGDVFGFLGPNGAGKTTTINMCCTLTKPPGGTARGLLHSPRVLFLDEPTIGLDPQTRRSIWSYIRTLKESEEITIFMTTHYMDEAEWCDRIAIMDQGVIVALDSPAALKAQVGADRIRIETEDDQAAIASLRDRFGVEAVISEGAVTFRIASGEKFVPRLVAELGVPIRSVSVSRPTSARSPSACSTPASPGGAGTFLRCSRRESSSPSVS